MERSTDQVIKPVNVGALSKWVGKIPPDVLQDMAVIAPMLAKLGYDPYANPPNYGKPDPKILENTRRVSEIFFFKWLRKLDKELEFWIVIFLAFLLSENYFKLEKLDFVECFIFRSLPLHFKDYSGSL